MVVFPAPTETATKAMEVLAIVKSIRLHPKTRNSLTMKLQLKDGME